jgi:uncharacterized protein YdaU (DUF1376 family)
LNYYPFHLGDYAAHTAHLEPMEDLAYRRLLDLYYRTECPLSINVIDIARLIRMRDFTDAIQTVLNEFFVLTDNGWTHARCDQEIAHMRDKQTKAKASAQASVNARQASAQRTLNERSATNTNTNTNTNTKEPPTPKGAVDNGFANFWNPYPRKTAKVQAQKAWAKLNPSEALQKQILEALAAQCKSEQWTKDGGSFIPHASTWLNQRRWEDQLPTGTEATKADIWAGAI